MVVERKIARVRPQELQVNPQVRTTKDDEEDRRLGESMKVRQLQPILARPDKTVIAGHRRHRAAMLVGLEFVDVIFCEQELSETEIRIIQLTENIHRQELTPWERWRACSELLRLNPGWGNKDLAEHLKLDPSSITRLMSVDKLIPEAKSAFVDGKLGISDAYELSKAADPAEQVQLLSLRLSGVSRDQLAQAGRKRRNGTGQPEERIARAKLHLPGGTVVSVAAAAGSAGATVGEIIEALQAALAECRAAEKAGISAKSLQCAMKDKASV